MLTRLAALSDGGYVLLRSGIKTDTIIEWREWRVNVRRFGREYTNSGATVREALMRSLNRLESLAKGKHA